MDLILGLTKFEQKWLFPWDEEIINPAHRPPSIIPPGVCFCGYVRAFVKEVDFLHKDTITALLSDVTRTAM